MAKRSLIAIAPGFEGGRAVAEDRLDGPGLLEREENGREDDRGGRIVGRSEKKN